MFSIDELEWIILLLILNFTKWCNLPCIINSQLLWAKFPSRLETFALGPTSYRVWLDFCYLIFAFNFMNQLFWIPVKRRIFSSALLKSNKFIWHFKSMRCCNLRHVLNNQHIFAIFPLYLTFVQPSIDHLWIRFFWCHFCTLGMEGFYLENLQKKTHNLFGIFNANLTKIFGHQQFKMNYFVGIIMLNIQMQSALCFGCLKKYMYC
jgi:hypothetical protein